MTTEVQMPGRLALLDRFNRTRAHSRELFDSISPDAYESRPIDLRHPIAFYEGHLAAFNVITLIRNALGRAGVDEKMEALFARGIDPDSTSEAMAAAPSQWPSRDSILEFAAASDRLIRAAISEDELDRPGHPLLAGAESLYCILEHEAMHQETLRYMLRELPSGLKKDQRTRRPPPPRAASQEPAKTVVPSGVTTLGASRDEIQFGWDNEFPLTQHQVAGFVIDTFSVTNREYLDFVNDGGYGRVKLWSNDGWKWISSGGIEHPHLWRRDGDVWRWRGMHREIDLPPEWPVWVSHAEAEAYARWSGARLPTEAEFHRAAFATSHGAERLFPWGDEPPDDTRGNFDFQFEEPVESGSYPAGRSAWGIHDLVGNGWEWTSTRFGPFPGFQPMSSYPGYSRDFFDGAHFVLKGASPATSSDLIRRSFRNWFRPAYPYVYAKFRRVWD